MKYEDNDDGTVNRYDGEGNDCCVASVVQETRWTDDELDILEEALKNRRLVRARLEMDRTFEAFSIASDRYEELLAQQ